jgi:heat shock protein HtpX
MDDVKVFGLVALLTGLVAAGGAVGGRGGMALAFIMAGGMNFGMFRLSSTTAPAMYGAEIRGRPLARAGALRRALVPVD